MLWNLVFLKSALCMQIFKSAWLVHYQGGGLILHLVGPFYLRDVIQVPHLVGHDLQEVLPQNQEEVEVEVTGVRLAVDAPVVLITHTLPAGPLVQAQPAVHAGV